MRLAPTLALLLSACLTSRAEYLEMLDYATDDDGDGFAEAQGDCDDDDPDVYPGADETWYDSVDQDCAGDSDHDRDGDGAVGAIDCDDQDAAVHPSAADTCNGRDDDCDGEVDEGLEQLWYRDDDDDGFGVSEDRVLSCLSPAGYAAQDGDCDDAHAAAYPGAAAICGDGIDNDCDGLGDCSLALSGYAQASQAQAFFVGDASHPFEGTLLGGHDWDDDGVPDILIGSRRATSGISDGLEGFIEEGAVYLFSSPLEGEYSQADSSKELGAPPHDHDHLGAALDGVDIDLDGVVELIIGSPKPPLAEHQTDAGLVYIVDAPLDVDLTPVEGPTVDRVYGQIDEGEFGAAVATGHFGDSRGPDLAVGAPGVDDLFFGRGEESGRVYLINGPLGAGDLSVSSARSATLVLTGLDHARLGEHLVNGGDLNGDGQDALLIGVPDLSFTYDGDSVRGMVAVLQGELSGEVYLTDAPGPKLLGSGTAETGLGEALSPAGDVNQDGYGDVLVGAWGWSSWSGRAWVLSGEALTDFGDDFIAPADAALAQLSGDSADDQLGAAVLGLGDVSPEGLPVSAVGAPGYGPRGYGAAFLFTGPFEGAMTPADATFEVGGISGTPELGATLAMAGDVDGMGITEILVGWGGGNGGALLLKTDAF